MAPSPLQLLLATVAAAVAGAVNSIAGGGTLITFPTLVAIGVPPIVANATSSVALWPGTVASMWAYRGALAGSRAWIARFGAPSVLGGAVGALLLLRTSEERFEAIVPLLVLGATGLFVAQGPIGEWLRSKRSVGGDDAPPPLADGSTRPLSPPPPGVLAYQFLVSVYGGYFGAGMGILMLAALGLAGLQNIHQMNGLKNWGAACINLVAVGVFAASGIVDWSIGAVMAAGAAIGGYVGSGLAQRVGQTAVRRAIITIGVASAIWLTIRSS